MSDQPEANNTPDPAPQEEAPKIPEITFDDFVKIKLKVGKVIEAQPHPNADKLILLQVDLGTEKRQICAGLRGFYEPEELLGKNIVVVANLPPRKMRGLESQGMLLAASNEDHSQVIVLTTEKDIAPGSSVS